LETSLPLRTIKGDNTVIPKVIKSYNQNKWIKTNVGIASSFFFFFTLDAGVLARIQYSGHLDTGFTWFPCACAEMVPKIPSCHCMLLT